ncbi:MAG TPA: UDP-N-acetylmuramate dehydrogenase [Acidimicrobiales bacterium]
MSRPADAIAAVADRLGELARRDVPLGPLTTYRVGGPARLLAEVPDEAALQRLTQAVSGTELDLLVVGKGSNLLVSDAGFDGLAVMLGDGFATIEIGDADRRPPGGAAADGATQVLAGGAVALPVLARTTAQAGLTGLEWAVGVPGSVGGGVRMNAGGHGSDIAATLVTARVVDLGDGSDRTVPAGELDLGYRRSAIGTGRLVVSAGFELLPGDAPTSMENIAEIVRWRRANQPGGQNAGSVFTNPPGDSAGRLVDAAGCRGLRKGSAQVSTKHANFVQADRGGTAGDVRALVELVRARVLDETGVRLESEIRFVGFTDPDVGHPGPGPEPRPEVEP